MLGTETPLARARQTLKPALLEAFAISLFINVALFSAPLYSMQVYDRVLSSRNLGTLAMLTMIALVFLLLYGILEYARSGILIRSGVRLHEALAKPVFELSMRAQLAGRPAIAAQAIKDAETLQDTVAGNTLSTLFDVPWVPVFIAICFLFHPALGLVALAGAILILVCALLTEAATKVDLADAAKYAAEGHRFTGGALRNVEAIRGLGMGEAVFLRWLALQNAARGAQSGASERSALLTSVTKFVRMSVQIALIGVGAWLAIDRLISPGVMMAVMIIMGRALAPVEMTVANWKRIIAGRTAYRRLNELFTALPEPPAATRLPEPNGALSVEGLVLRQPNGNGTLLKDVTFAIPAGSLLAIIGPSGSGKSTLAKVLAGICRPTLGTVRLDGAALSQWDPAQLGPHIGYLPQDIEFFAGTIAENIARLAEPDDAYVIAAAQAAGVHEAILRQPQAYQTVLGDGDTVLSGGMRQRLALARALYGNPRILIMDEPNSNLDQEGELALAQALEAMKTAGRTVVLITHKPQVLAHVDRILVLAAGHVQAFGGRDEVLAKLSSSRVAPIRRVPARTSAETTVNDNSGSRVA